MGAAGYAETVDSYLADCRRRGLRPATARSYDASLERFRAATGIDDLGGLTLRVHGQPTGSTKSAGSTAD